MIEPVATRVSANGLAHRVLRWDPAGGDAPGAPIVLAHGFLDHAWSWHPVAQHLVAAGRRVLAFDWRGHGETEWIGAGGYYHFPDYVLDLHALLPAIAGSEYALVGHSMGGTACAMFAGTRPEGLRSVVLCEGLGPPAMPLESFADRMSSFVASVARARAPRASRAMRDVDDAARRLRQQHADLDETLARFLAEKGTRAIEGGLEWRFDPLHRTTSPTPFRPEGLGSLLARIEVPTLLVRGTRGYRTDDHDARVAAIPRASEIVLDDVGHMMHWQAPDRLARAILEHT